MDRNYWDSLGDCYEENLLEIAREDRAGALSEELSALGGPGIRVADLGCGPGSLLSLLARHFEEVIAVDYAKQLLDRARQRCRSRKISYACHDLSRGTKLPFQVEVICCINALIDPDRSKRRGMLRSLRSALREQGVAIIVVPAFESVFHVYHTLRSIRERSRAPEGLSAEEAERLLRGEVHSFSDGIVRVGGVPTKYWLREELMAALAEQDLRLRRIRRVEYPWSEEIENPPRWLEGARPWDWLVVCEG
ncbi:MAG TPA: hypothetical protein DCS85_05415 [Verrucomicrobiales bacterium]|nr:hypothetical protein [Deltaproteobacteria bacterium]HAT19575.1 hypothetical protein [Verrucomicrobiales bacterium]